MRVPRARRIPTAEVEQLASSLDGGAPAADPLVTVARALKAETAREDHRAVTKERMLRAFALAESPAPLSPDAGSRDALTPTADVYVAEVSLPGGGRVLMADVEHISAERAAATSQGVYFPMAQESTGPDDTL